jgi:hypothetical protein
MKAKKIQITLEVNPKEVTIANYILAQSIRILEGNPELRKHWRITRYQLRHGRNFRKQLLDKFLADENKLLT